MNLRPLSRAITRNFAWKLGSLLLAVVLWLAIVAEPDAVMTHAVPILYRNLDSALLIGSDTIDSVRIDMRGPAGRLSSAAIADVAVELDLSDIKKPGERTFTLSDDDLRLPDGVTFLRAIPSQLRLHFSRRKTKDVPVEVRISAFPPAGYAITRQQVEPGQVQIAGPEPRVDAIAAAQTDLIDLSHATQSGEYRVNTFLPDPQVWFESGMAVTVKLTIEKRDEK